MQVCLSLCERTWYISLCWSEETVLFEGDQHRLSWAFLVIYSCSKTPAVITMGSLCFKNKHHIFLCYLRVELCISTLGVGGVGGFCAEAFSTLKCERRDSGGNAQQALPHLSAYSLSTSCWVMVCPIQLPPTTHTSSNVSLWLHGRENSVQTCIFHFAAIAHYIEILNV